MPDLYKKTAVRKKYYLMREKTSSTQFHLKKTYFRDSRI